MKWIHSVMQKKMGIGLPSSDKNFQQGDAVEILTNYYSPVLARGEKTTILGVAKIGDMVDIGDGQKAPAINEGWYVQVAPRWRSYFPHGVFVEWHDIRKV